MDNALKNSTLGKVAYHLRIERFQIDAIKFERTQIHVMFSLLLSSLLLIRSLVFPGRLSALHVLSIFCLFVSFKVRSLS